MKALLVLVVVGAALAWFYPEQVKSALHPADKFQASAAALVGRSQQEVLDQFGEPKHVVTLSDLKGGRKVDYPWESLKFYPVPDRKVRNKVYLCSQFNSAAYVFINEQGRVESVEMATQASEINEK